jgi:hypothetical protein
MGRGHGGEVTTLEAAIVVLNGAIPSWRERPELAEAFRIVDAAGAFKAEPAPARYAGKEAAHAYTLGYARGEAAAWASITKESDEVPPDRVTIARDTYEDLLQAATGHALSAEPTITKAEAYEIARRCALSGGRHYWAEPEFDSAWAAVTGAK